MYLRRTQSWTSGTSYLLCEENGLWKGLPNAGSETWVNSFCLHLNFWAHGDLVQKQALGILWCLCRKCLIKSSDWDSPGKCEDQIQKTRPERWLKGIGTGAIPDNLYSISRTDKAERTHSTSCFWHAHECPLHIQRVSVIKGWGFKKLWQFLQ